MKKPVEPYDYDSFAEDRADLSQHFTSRRPTPTYRACEFCRGTGALFGVCDHSTYVMNVPFCLPEEEKAHLDANWVHIGLRQYRPVAVVHKYMEIIYSHHLRHALK